MGLIERLVGVELPKIAAHQFTAALGEQQRGKMTRAQVISAFGIAVGDEPDLDLVIAKILPAPEQISIGSFVTLTAVGAAFDTTTASKGLGLAYVQAAGISRMEICVQVTKVGTGTQSWQLWNETDASEIIIANDAGAAADRQMIGSKDFTPPLTVGMKVVRIRAKSTVAGDSPVFRGCGITIYRVNQMWSKILEEVCVLAEKGIPPLDSVALVRTRLGI